MQVTLTSLRSKHFPLIFTKRFIGGSMWDLPVDYCLVLTYPAQLHLNHKHLRDFLVRSGPKKSILKYNSLNAKSENQASEEFKTINLILNNFFDIEGYRNLVINPPGVSK